MTPAACDTATEITLCAERIHALSSRQHGTDPGTIAAKIIAVSTIHRPGCVRVGWYVFRHERYVYSLYLKWARATFAVKQLATVAFTLRATYLALVPEILEVRGDAPLVFALLVFEVCEWPTRALYFFTWLAHIPCFEHAHTCSSWKQLGGGEEENSAPKEPLIGSAFLPCDRELNSSTCMPTACAV